MHDGRPDLWGVWANLDRVRANLNQPLLKGWREQHLNALAGDLDKPLEFPGEAGDVMRRCSENAQMLGFAHVLTGDGRFARRGIQALECMLENDQRWDCIAHNEMYPRDTADLITSEVTKDTASALNFLWPELGPGLRGDLVSLIAQRGGKPIYDGAVAGCWWGNALNSNWTAVFNSGLAFAALVLRESDPGFPATGEPAGEHPAVLPGRVRSERVVACDAVRPASSSIRKHRR